MNRLLQAIQGYLPRRRRRRWRFVSGRRRRVGSVLFAVLIAALYGWWHFTNDDRVEFQAEQYLRKLTGAEVRVHAAEFRVFEGIKLSGVRIFHRRQGRREDLFEAREVYLQPRFLGLLAGQGLEVRQIICVQPTVTLVQDVDRGTWNVLQLLSPGRVADPDAQRPRHLPTVLLREGTIVRKNIRDGQELPVGRIRAMSARLAPDGDSSLYAYEIVGPGPDQKPEVLAQGQFNLRTGQYSFNVRRLLQDLDLALPQKYQQWRQRYSLSGKLQLTGESGADPSQPQWRARLDGASIALPADEGSLALTDLQGELLFSGDGVQIVSAGPAEGSVGIRGRLPQLNGATVTIAGQFTGYEAQSPFRVHIECDELRLPVEQIDPAGPLAVLTQLQELFQPVGRARVVVDIVRGEDGRIRTSGSFEPLGMQATFVGFAYRLDELSGRIEVSDEQVALKALRGRHGPTRVSVDGVILDAKDFAGHVNVVADELAFDDELRDALDEGSQRLWDEFQPAGRCRMTVAVARDRGPDAPWQRRIEMQFDGAASMLYRGFPYPVEAVEGSLVISGRDAVLDKLRGRHGPARVSVDGTVDNAGTSSSAVEINIVATDVPLDGELGRALPEQARGAYEAFALSGRGDANGHFVHRAEQGLDFTLTTTVKDASLCYEDFAYPIDSVVGVLRITPREVTVDRLVGRRGKAQVVATGQVRIDHNPVGIDLTFDAADVSMDRPLRQALPPQAAALWEALQPEGVGDVAVTLRSAEDRAREKGLDYAVTLQARDMAFTYRGFPYRVEGVRGTVEATPGKVQVVELTGGSDGSPVTLSGNVLHDGQGDRADLTLTAKRVPIDQRLIAAMPESLQTLAGAMQSGGWADVELRGIRYVRTPAPPTGQPAETQPATQPADQVHWELDGRVTVRDASVSLGMGARQISGHIDGALSGGANGQALAANAQLVLDSVSFGEREVRKLTGTVRKSADGRVMRISDLTGEAYGGRMAGMAELIVGPAGEYGLALTVEKVQLDALLNAGRADPAKTAAGNVGELAGTLRLAGVLGDADSRRATGRLQITQANVSRLPVMLGLMNVVLLQLPVNNAISAGSLTYHIKGDTLTFEEISLLGGETSLLGRGTLDLKTDKLALTFLSGPPRETPPLLSLLPELISTATQGFAKIRVTGTLRNPKVDTYPLRDVETFLKEMLTPPG